MIRKLSGLLALGALAMMAPAGAASAAAATSNQRFTVVVRVTNGSLGCSVIASGPITGAGVCAPEDVLGDGPHVVHVTLNSGSFDLTATTVSESDDFNDAACMFRFSSTETFSLSGVSGAYGNLHGSGTDTARGLLLHSRTANGCSDDLAAGVITVNAVATVTL